MRRVVASSATALAPFSQNSARWPRPRFGPGAARAVEAVDLVDPQQRAPGADHAHLLDAVLERRRPRRGCRRRGASGRRPSGAGRRGRRAAPWSWDRSYERGARVASRAGRGVHPAARASGAAPKVVVPTRGRGRWTGRNEHGGQVASEVPGGGGGRRGARLARHGGVLVRRRREHDRGHRGTERLRGPPVPNPSRRGRSRCPSPRTRRSTPSSCS